MLLVLKLGRTGIDLMLSKCIAPLALEGVRTAFGDRKWLNLNVFPSSARRTYQLLPLRSCALRFPVLDSRASHWR